MTEREFQRIVVDLAKLFRWRYYHTYDSRRSNPGFPDLVLVRERILYRELKTDKGKLTFEQRQWLEYLTGAGADAKVWRPADLDDIARELGG